MVPAGKKAKRILLVNHNTKTIHYHHCHHGLFLIYTKSPKAFTAIDDCTFKLQVYVKINVIKNDNDRVYNVF